MNKGKTEFNFRPYSEAEADQFIKEYPLVKCIGQWIKNFRVVWNNTNPSEHWYALNYRKSENEPSPYFSLERDLWVVGGHDLDFLLVRIDLPEQSRDSDAIKWLKCIRDQSVECRFDEGSTKITEGAAINLLFRTSIQTRTSRHGELYCCGDKWGYGEKFYYKQMARFRNGKDWKEWV